MCQACLQLPTFFRVHTVHREQLLLLAEIDRCSNGVFLGIYKYLPGSAKASFVLQTSSFVKCNLFCCFSVFQDVGLLEIQTFAASDDSILHGDHTVLGFSWQPSQVLVTFS